jgi:hypothetical protein
MFVRVAYRGGAIRRFGGSIRYVAGVLDSLIGKPHSAKLAWSDQQLGEVREILGEPRWPHLRLG